MMKRLKRQNKKRVHWKQVDVSLVRRKKVGVVIKPFPKGRRSF